MRVYQNYKKSPCGREISQISTNQHIDFQFERFLLDLKDFCVNRTPYILTHPL